MRVARAFVVLLAATLVACASAPPAPPPAPPPNASEDHDTAPDDPAPAAPAASADGAERAASSTRSYEEALSTPERLDVNDERAHLTDTQLTGPMRGVLAGCSVSSNARITIKTAVQYGRAIGVTVNVRFDRPKSAKPLSKVAAKAEAKRIAKIVACVERAVRAVTWPPSGRRDSFTTEF